MRFELRLQGAQPGLVRLLLCDSRTCSLAVQRHPGMDCEVPEAPGVEDQEVRQNGSRIEIDPRGRPRLTGPDGQQRVNENEMEL